MAVRARFTDPLPVSTDTSSDVTSLSDTSPDPVSTSSAAVLMPVPFTSPDPVSIEIALPETRVTFTSPDPVSTERSPLVPVTSTRPLDVSSRRFPLTLEAVMSPTPRLTATLFPSGTLITRFAYASRPEPEPAIRTRPPRFWWRVSSSPPKVPSSRTESSVLFPRPIAS